MNNRVLLIDDDVNLLSSMKRQLRKQYDVITATSGEEGVDVITASSPQPSVVICDMRMGGMSGVETLAKIKDISPDTIRLMLTGNADMQTAIDAINNGNIFRFLTKPCPPEQLQAGLEAALTQHRLIMAERELLEKTLAGSVKVLIDMLAMASPHAFGRATRVRGWVRKVGPALQLQQRWQVEIAAMLGPIGMLSVPIEVMAKLHAKEPLSDVEAAMVDRSPEAARNIIANIPRLAAVSKAVYLQNKYYDGKGFPADGPAGTDIPLNARVLKILNALSEVCEKHSPSRTDFEALSKRVGQFDPSLLERIRKVLEVKVDLGKGDRPSSILTTGLLIPDMVLAADVVTSDGRLVLSAMVPISAAHVESLRNLASLKRIPDKIRVFDPVEEDELS